MRLESTPEIYGAKIHLKDIEHSKRTATLRKVTPGTAEAKRQKSFGEAQSIPRPCRYSRVAADEVCETTPPSPAGSFRVTAQVVSLDILSLEIFILDFVMLTSSC